MNKQEIIDWLLTGDVSIQFQVYRDLLGKERKELQERIALEGWGKMFLSYRKKDGHWGRKFYQPKWISTHYTLLDLRNLNISPNLTSIQRTIDNILRSNKSIDGGILLGPSTSINSDLCVNGMFLNYASYFHIEETNLRSNIDMLLNEIMLDGGFNCRTKRSGAIHSSLHSTLSVLEGLFEFQKAGYTYRQEEILEARKSAEEFMLQHRLFLSDQTGEIIQKDFLKITYPSRWKYDILRALDYTQYSGAKWDERMREAINVILEKQNKNGLWNMQAAHPGQVHFLMEKAGKPSRWNTLRALRVLKHFEIETTSVP